MVSRFRPDRSWGWSLCVLALLLCHARNVHAEAVGSPASILKKGRWVMGLGGGGLSARSLKGDAEAVVYQGGHFRGYGLTDWVSLYGKIGGAYLEVDDPSIKKPKDPSTTNSFGGNLFTSIQLKAKIFEHKTQDWEWDGSLQYVDLRARHKDKNESRWHEWQVATSLAKSFGRLKPYVGVKISRVDFTFKVREEGAVIKQGTYRQDGSVGPFVGSDVYFGDHEDVILNVESSYVGGLEMTVAISYTFY